MYEWLLYVLSLFAPSAPPQVQYAEDLPQDYVGMVACEAAYTTLLPKRDKPAPAPVDPANCPTCKGLGKVRTGDLQGWTKCPTCKGGTGESAEATPAVTSEPCLTGTCAVAKPQVSSPAPAAVSTPAPQPYTRRQVIHAR